MKKTTQMGDTQYSANFKIQPSELIQMCEWNSIQGNIAKYVLQYKCNNSSEDIRKAISYCWIEKHYTEYEKLHPITIEVFCRINELDTETREILRMIDRMEYMHMDVKLSEILTRTEKKEK